MGSGKGFRVYVLPLGLIVLLGILATLQYRWTGEISAAERARMQASLRSSTFRFARDVNEELLGLIAAFRVESETELAASLAARLDRWRTESSYPDLVQQIYVFRPDEESTLLVLKGGELGATTWPDELSPLRARLEGVEEPEGGEPMRRRAPPPFLLDAPPCLAIPMGSPRSVRPGMAPRGLVLVLLRDDVLKDKVLPELEARHFGPEFDMVILDLEGKVVFRSSEAEPSEVVASADAEAPLFTPRGFFGNMPGMAPPRQGLELGRPGARERRGPVGFRGPFREGGRELMEGRWRVFVRHRAGSLDAAVAKARRRNLAVSFAVMGLLAASVLLVSVSARRATELSERKMEFVAGVSHELRTPVAVIRSAGQNLADGSVSEPSRVAHYGRVIEAEGRRLEDLLEQVLELAGIQSLKQRYESSPVSVREILTQAIADNDRLARESNVTVSLESSQPDLEVLADREALRHAIANLVGNAIKHGGPAERVEVHFERQPERRVAVRVVDHGPGIPSHEREHIFEAFYRGRRAQDQQVAGSGLGLSVVDHIVRALGGTIEVESSPGGGATFTVVLPAAEET